MIIENIQSVIAEPSLNPLMQVANLGDKPAQSTSGFGQIGTQGLEKINESLMNSQVDMQNLAVGNVTNLHNVMINIEESRLSFQLMMQVRNRLLEAYQDVMRMQV